MKFFYKKAHNSSTFFASFKIQNLFSNDQNLLF